MTPELWTKNAADREAELDAMASRAIANGAQSYVIGSSTIRTILDAALPPLPPEPKFITTLTGSQFRRCDDGTWEYKSLCGRWESSAVSDDYVLKMFSLLPDAAQYKKVECVGWCVKHKDGSFATWTNGSREQNERRARACVGENSGFTVSPLYVEVQP